MSEASSALSRRLHLMADVLRDARIDEAEAMYQALCEEHPPVRQMQVFPVLFAIQRGHLNDALQLVDSQGPQRYPELRALCLRLLEDPTWEGEAEALLDSPDAAVARAMRQLLGRPSTPLQ